MIAINSIEIKIKIISIISPKIMKKISLKAVKMSALVVKNNRKLVLIIIITLTY